MAYVFNDDKTKKNIQTKTIGINLSNSKTIPAKTSISFEAVLAESISDASIIFSSEVLLYQEDIPDVLTPLYGIIPLFCKINISSDRVVIALMNFGDYDATLFVSQIHIRVVYA